MVGLVIERGRKRGRNFSREGQPAGGAQPPEKMVLTPFFLALSALMLAVAVAVPAAGRLGHWAAAAATWLGNWPVSAGQILHWAGLLHQSREFGLTYAAISAVSALAVLWSRRGKTAIQQWTALAAHGPVLRAYIAGPRGERSAIAMSDRSTPSAVAQVKQDLPPGTQLASFGFIDPLFAYYYRDPIRYVPWPKPGERFDTAIVYFCFGNDSPPPGKLPLHYERFTRFLRAECGGRTSAKWWWANASINGSEASASCLWVVVNAGDGGRLRGHAALASLRGSLGAAALRICHPETQRQRP